MMFRKAIAGLLLCAGVAHAQSTSGWQTVTTEGTGLFTNLTDIAEDIELVKPAYFCFTGGSDPRVTADTVDLVGGGLVSGTVTNTRAIDQSYYIVDESSRPDIRFTHTNILTEPIEVLFEGYYDGNPSHTWGLYLWDYVANDWDLIGLNVLTPKDGTDFSVIVPIPEPQTNYNFGGVVTSRWYHSAGLVGANEVGFDYTAILQASVTIPTSGVFEAVGGFMECVTSKRFNVNMTEGTATNTTAGVYEITFGGSSTGSTNTQFHAALFTNDVISMPTIQLYRTIGGQGTVGNAWGHGLINLSADTKLQVKLTSDRSGSHASFFDFKFKGTKVDY